jgi:miniconductance mechanosensitive channel
MSSKSENFIYEWLDQKLIKFGIAEAYVDYVSLFVLFFSLLALLGIIDFVSRKLLVSVFTKAARKTKTQFDDHLVKNRTLVHLARLIPLSIFLQLIPFVFAVFPEWITPAKKFADILLVVSWVLLLRAVFRSVRDHFRAKPSLRDKPLDSYLQVVNIFMIFIAGIVIFSLFTGKSPWTFLTAMGAASAILMLVFKDTILGFVASIQVSTNDMVRIGDWIEMPKYGADGDVLEINLNTVKVQNWDKTITTIPTYYLITDSFKNWRGMHHSGGRRIKRAINIKISSIRYLSREEIAELKKIQLLAPYIEERQKEIDEFNTKNQTDLSMPVNGRNMTNVGLFRQYINRYAQNHPGIKKDMTLLVRQLAPTEHGLPIELYMFTNQTLWAVYENTMADIFDHLLSAIKFFQLEIFEAPASDDVRGLKLSIEKI